VKKILVLEISSGNAIDMEPSIPDQDDPMGPPAEPCECFCLHCRRTFMSDRMWFQRVINARDGFSGFWMCPTPNCGGAGFTMDIFPTDPDHPANAGWTDFDDDGEEDDDEAADFEEDGAAEEETEYDPAERKYAELDEAFGEEDDDDLEGEEWKHGPVSGDEPKDPPPISPAQREWEEEEKRYDMPDERPRVVDWSDREYPAPPRDDDIPF
jgi:hypothetical protein